MTSRPMPSRMYGSVCRRELLNLSMHTADDTSTRGRGIGHACMGAQLAAAGCATCESECTGCQRLLTCCSEVKGSPMSMAKP